MQGFFFGGGGHGHTLNEYGQVWSEISPNLYLIFHL